VSPDGRGIIYAATVNDAPVLQMVSVAEKTIQTIRTPGPAVDPFANFNGTIGYLEPFPGGKGQANVNRVAFARASGEAANIEGLRSLNLANGFAVISPDRRRLAAIVDPGGASASIWVSELGAGAQFLRVADLPSEVRPRGAHLDARQQRPDRRNDSACDPSGAVRSGEVETRIDS
jgi:hypothetical protein